MCAGRGSLSVHRLALGPVSFAKRNEIGKETICARHARRELAEECQTCVDEMAFAVIRDEQPAFQWRFPRITARENGNEMIIPLIWKIRSAFLDPVIEIRLGDFIGLVQDRIIRREE